MRFECGEIAIFMFGISTPKHDGMTCQVIEAETRARDTYVGMLVSDYVVEMSNGDLRICYDWQLRKLNPPAEPASLTRHSEQDVPA